MIDKTTKTSVFSVAAYLIEKYAEDESRPTLMSMRLQKLICLAQGIHLAFDKIPLFKEPLEAYVLGPIVKVLFDHNWSSYIPKEIPKEIGDAETLSESEKESIDTVLVLYGGMSYRDLCLVTCFTKPHLEAREREDKVGRDSVSWNETCRKSRTIRLGDLQEHHEKEVLWQDPSEIPEHMKETSFPVLL